MWGEAVVASVNEATCGAVSHPLSNSMAMIRCAIVFMAQLQSAI
jgi:hypothetical protein